MQAVAEKEEVETFVGNAQATLGKAAASIEEIGSARQAAKTLVAALPHIMDCRRRIDEKNRLLKSMVAAGNLSSVGQAVDMTQVDNAWDSFTAQLQQHDTHLDEQKNQLQGHLARQVFQLPLCCSLLAFCYVQNCIAHVPQPFGLLSNVLYVLLRQAACTAF